MNGDIYNVNITDLCHNDKLFFKNFFYNNNSLVWNKILYKESIKINLSELNYIHDGAIWLAYIVAYRKNKKLTTVINLPTNNDVISFLKGIDFGRLADGIYTHFLNASAYDKSEAKYIYKDEKERNVSKLISINGTSISINLNNLKRYLYEYLMGIPFQKFSDSNISHLIKSNFLTPTTELIKNITDYGGSVLGSGIGCCSLIPPIRTSKYIRYCFLDIGKGFKASLLEKNHDKEFQKLGEIYNDKDAILKGLLFRRSIKKENIIGLYPVLGIICATRGSIGIRSGNAIVEISFKKMESKYDDFKSNYFNGLNKPIDEKLLGFNDDILNKKKCEKIPGSQIYIDLGIDNIDMRFLQDISQYLENRGD